MDHASREYCVRPLLRTTTLTLLDVRCGGDCRHKSTTRSSPITHLVFPYRGVFVRHVGNVETVAEANQLVFVNGQEEYKVSHPVEGGDACLSVKVDAAVMVELVPSDQLAMSGVLRFNCPRRGIDPRAQALVALLRHGLSRGTMETIEAESLTLAMIRRSLGDRTCDTRASSYGHRKLVDRTKLLLSADPGRRWTLAAIARDVGVSAVYLTQVFAQVEGVPLYRYQMRLRLARALDMLGDCPDLTMLALDLGFSSHSHFSAAFRQHYGRSPTEFQRAAQLK